MSSSLLGDCSAAYPQSAGPAAYARASHPLPIGPILRFIGREIHPFAHQGKLKFTSTVVTTSTGVPLSRVGLYSHCLTASVADCTNSG